MIVAGGIITRETFGLGAEGAGHHADDCTFRASAQIPESRARRILFWITVIVNPAPGREGSSVQAFGQRHWLGS